MDEVTPEHLTAALETIRQYLNAPDACGISVSVYDFTTIRATAVGIFIRATGYNAIGSGRIVPGDTAAVTGVALEPMHDQDWAWMQTYGPVRVKVVE